VGQHKHRDEETIIIIIFVVGHGEDKSRFSLINTEMGKIFVLVLAGACSREEGQL